LSFSPDGTKLAVGHWGFLRLIDFPASLANGTSVELYTIYPSQDLIFKTAFSPDGLYLASAGRDALARVVDAATGEPRFELTGMSNSVLGIQFSPDGRYIRAASFDGTLHKHVVSTEDLIDLAYRRLTRWWRPQECSTYLYQTECPEPQQEIIRVDYATSPNEFAGTWQTESVLADTYLRFKYDGRLIMAQTLEDLDDAPFVEATYEMDREILSMQDPLCGDPVGQYHLRLVREPGQALRLILASVQDDCLPRRIGLNGSYVQVAP
jgi:WD40 repeat protein